MDANRRINGDRLRTAIKHLTISALAVCVALFGAIDASAQTASATAKRSIDKSTLRSAHRDGRIQITLPDGRMIRFDALERRERNSVQSLRGISGNAKLWMTTDGNAAFGSVDDGVQRYDIITSNGQTTVAAAEQTISTALAQSSMRNDTVIDTELVDRIRRNMERSQSSDKDLAHSTIDIAIFIDPAIYAHDSEQTLRTYAQAAIDYTNEAFRTNAIPLELRLVLVETYSGTIAPLDPFPGFPIHTLTLDRSNAFGADMRHLLFEFRQGIPYCGKAYLVGASGVTGFSCGFAAFAHEIGHNLGANHDRANAGSTAGLPIDAYNYGYTCGGIGSGGKGTLMSYVGTGKVPHFSSPSLTDNGGACGVAIGQPNAAHNGAAIDAMRVQIESLRAPATSYGTVHFQVAAASLSEAGAAVDVVVVRDGDTSRATSVEVGAVDATATNELDYLASAVRLAFAAGETTKTFRITPIDDEDYEVDETFRVVLRYPDGLTDSGTPIVVTISSDDIDRGIASLEIASISVWENGGPVTVAIVRTGNTANPLTIQYVTADDTATAGTHYQSVSGSVTFAAGETRKTVTVPIIDNNQYDSTRYRTFQFRLSGANLGTNRIEYITVFNDDPNRGVATFVANTVSIAETGQVLALTVARLDGAESTLQVNYATQSGTAVAGRDFTAATGSLIFAVGEQSKSISIPIIDNPRFDGDRTFTIALTGSHLGLFPTTTATIQNDDPNRGLAELSLNSLTISETAGSVVLTVNRTQGSESTLTVDYTTENETALAGSDFTSTAGTITFAAGQTSAAITIPIINDTGYDPGESFRLRLTGPLLGATTLATISIDNDDAAPPPPADDSGGGSFDSAWLMSLLLLLFARDEKRKRRPTAIT
jgi:Calx-beta domain/Metallo-peptidase family M12B Reprolysin-like